MLRAHTKRVIVFTFAVIFIVLGILGLVLPFLQGILFIIIGVLLLSAYSPTVRVYLDRHTTKYPKLHAYVLKAEAFITRIIGENNHVSR